MKITLLKIALLITPLLVLFLVVEYILFKPFLAHVPLRIQNRIPPYLRPLTQSSKKDVLPKDYILILGDSYAQGLGDWFHDVDKNTNDPFHSAHVIQQLTQRDVINFGQGGVGSLSALVAQPTKRFRYLNSFQRFKIPPPKDIVVYFYEGNDLNNNLNELEIRFDPVYGAEKRTDPDAFAQFLEQVVIGKKEFTLKFVSLEFAARGLYGIGKWMGRKILGKEEPGPDVWGAGQLNQVKVAGKNQFLPDRLQSPALELTNEEIQISLFVFDQSMAYLKSYFPKAHIQVVYIPSPLSCYDLVGEKVSIEPYHGRPPFYPKETVWKQSDEIFSRMQALLQKQNIALVDPRSALRALAQSEFIHGPKDFFHLNKIGYTRLAEVVVSNMKSKKRPLL